MYKTVILNRNDVFNVFKSNKSSFGEYKTSFKNIFPNFWPVV